MTIGHLCYRVVITCACEEHLIGATAVALHGSYTTVCSIHVVAARRPRVCEPHLVVAVLEDLLAHLLGTTRAELRNAQTLRKTEFKLRKVWTSL